MIKRSLAALYEKRIINILTERARKSRVIVWNRKK